VSGSRVIPVSPTRPVGWDFVRRGRNIVKLSFLHEPELEFGTAATHVDISCHWLMPVAEYAPISESLGETATLVIGPDRGAGTRTASPRWQLDLDMCAAVANSSSGS